MDGFCAAPFIADLSAANWPASKQACRTRVAGRTVGDFFECCWSLGFRRTPVCSARGLCLGGFVEGCFVVPQRAVAAGEVAHHPWR
jgi:hypothetical protein